MQAVILAGGKGTRLQPLTSRTPKPMVKLFGKPVIEHTIDLLKRHGVRDIVITVAYKAEQIMEHFGNGSKWGVNIQYSIEGTPRGTAGGLRTIQPIINDTFLIISGDAVTDLDLTAALDFHKRRSALATLLTYEVKDPSAFGVVDSDGDGLIRRFQEKPKLAEAFSNKVNTGIYIFEPEVISYIPSDSVFDFAKGVFPRLLQNSEPFYSYRAQGYWCDMGNLAQFRNVHFDALTGKVKLDIEAHEIADGIWVGRDADVHPTVKLMSPLYIGTGSRLQRKTSLGRFAVVGDGSIIAEGAHIRHSILGNGSTIGKNASVYGSIIASGYKLNEGHQISDEVIVPDGSPSGLRADIDSEMLIHSSIDGSSLTWSALQASTTLSRYASAQPVAA
jgi:mannose-1-phosphate guanylyltransferase/phosphomannomutase